MISNKGISVCFPHFWDIFISQIINLNMITFTVNVKLYGFGILPKKISWDYCATTSVYIKEVTEYEQWSSA